MTMLRTICVTLRRSDIIYEESNTLLSCRIVNVIPDGANKHAREFVTLVVWNYLLQPDASLVSFDVLDSVNDLSMTQVLTNLSNTTIIYFPSWILQKTEEFIWTIDLFVSVRSERSLVVERRINYI